jgi:signal transduction histidine kinase
MTHTSDQPSTASLSANTVLVVEDSPVQAAMLKRVLLKAGLNVTLATDGAEALRISEQTPPDLIISDVVMPEMDGLQLCRALRALPETPRFAVLLLTSLASADDILSGLAAGADDYLIKPYDNQRLLDKVAQMLASHGSASANGADADALTGEPIDFEHDGHPYRIPFRPQTILRLLTSTYEHAVRQNEELIQARQAVRLANQELEQKVVERTAELSQANEQLEKSLKLLYSTEEQLIQSEKLTAVGTMVGGIVHEINNPVMGAINYVQYAIESTTDDDLLLVLGKAEARLAQVTKLVDSMLRYVRQDDAGLEAVDLRALLDETLELMRPELKTHQVELDDQLSASLPLVSASRIGLQQVLANLIKNAIDALEDTRGKKIRISGQREDGQVLLAVADNGPGVPDPLRRQIFDAFFTTKPKGKGTGLGLAICQRILHGFNASIAYSSAVGGNSKDDGGACFVVTLQDVSEDKALKTDGAPERSASD